MHSRVDAREAREEGDECPGKAPFAVKSPKHGGNARHVGAMRAGGSKAGQQVATEEHAGKLHAGPRHAQGVLEKVATLVGQREGEQPQYGGGAEPEAGQAEDKDGGQQNSSGPNLRRLGQEPEKRFEFIRPPIDPAEEADIKVSHRSSVA